MPKGGGYFTAWKYGNVLEHRGTTVPVMNSEDLEKLASEGIEMFNMLVETLDFQKKLDALRDLDKFHQDVLYGDWLVRNKMPDPKK